MPGSTLGLKWLLSSSLHIKAMHLSFSIHIPGPAELLPLYHRPGECLQVSLCEISLRGHLPSHWDGLKEFLLIFIARCGTLLLSIGPLGAWYGAGAPPSSVGTSTTKVSHLVFNHYLWVWGHCVLFLCSSYQSQCCLFFMSLVTGLLFS